MCIKFLGVQNKKADASPSWLSVVLSFFSLSSSGYWPPPMTKNYSLLNVCTGLVPALEQLVNDNDYGLDSSG